jgi:hydroxypyruvate isomerase
MLKFTANLSMLFTEMDLIDRFKAAKAQGFSAVEIQFPYPLSAIAIKQALEENNLKLVLFNVAADDLLQGGEGLACVPEKREQFTQAVEHAATYAELIQPEIINVLPGRCLHQGRQQEYLATFKENLSFATDIFSAMGIKTVFEAINSHDMPGFIIDTGEHMLEVLAQLKNPNVLMQYDIYHAQMMGDNPAEFITRHADQIGHIQFADCPGRGQPGTGQIDFAKVFSAIEKSNYAGWVGAEYKPVEGTAGSLGWLN